MKATREGIIRADGRTPSQLRTLQCEHSHLTKADGSCRFSLGKTCVDVSVFGPVEDPKNFDHSRIDRATLFVEVKSTRAAQSHSEVYLEKEIESVFEGIVLLQKYPQCVIHVHVQVVCDDGSVDSCAFNAVSVALLDAGIECKTLMAAVTLGLTTQIEDRIGLLAARALAKAKAESRSDETEDVDAETDARSGMGGFSEEATVRMSDASITDQSGDISMSGKSQSDESSKVSSKTGDSSFQTTKIQPVVVFDPSSRELESLSCVATVAYATKIGDKSALELEYCNTRGKMQLKALQTLLEHAKGACFKIQFSVKRHLVEAYKMAPTIWVEFGD